jgi:Chaperone of endosialidase/Major tropism determinant N-terminal domain
MADQITKIIIRNGTNEQRRTANTTGITFNVGEPAFCIDTQRLYVGDGSVGGVSIGAKVIPKIQNLFGSYNGTGWSLEGYNTLLLNGADRGDLIYDKTTRALYTLSARSNFTTSPVPSVSDLATLDIATQINSSYFYYDNLVLNITQQGIDRTRINGNAADGITLTKTTAGSPFSLALGSASTGVGAEHIRFIQPNSLHLNRTNSLAGPVEQTVQPGQVIGRTSTSTLSAVNINQMLYAANFAASNGLAISNTSTGVTYSVDSAYLSFASTLNTSIKDFYVATSTASTTNATGALTVAGGVGIAGALNVGGDITAFATSDERLKKNITIIPDALDKVNKISGVGFEWNEKSGKTGKDYGVIAQEIEKVLPELVVTRDDGYKAVRYEKIIALLIEAVKELNKKIS